LLADLGFGVEIMVRVRLQGIDTPEIHNVKHGTPERKAGMFAAEAAMRWFEFAGKVVIRTTKAKGKFGRYLADIENERGDDLAQHLLSGGHGIAVDKDGNAIERRDEA